jgi:uncharacterized protein (DUF3084 family)
MGGIRPDLDGEGREEQTVIDRETRRSARAMRPSESSLDAWVHGLRNREAELDTREDDVERRDTAMRLRETVADVRESAADRRDAYLAERTAYLDAREGHLDWRAARLAEQDGGSDAPHPAPADGPAGS